MDDNRVSAMVSSDQRRAQSSGKVELFWHRNEDVPPASRNIIKKTVIEKDMETMLCDVWLEISETGGILGVTVLSLEYLT